MNRSGQKGVALILTLILLFVLSVMAVSLMFISQTETWSSLNYRLTSQARDGAEAGINSAANFIVSPSTYTEAGGCWRPRHSAYVTTVSPVTYGGHPVTLSAMGHPDFVLSRLLCPNRVQYRWRREGQPEPQAIRQSITIRMQRCFPCLRHLRRSVLYHKHDSADLANRIGGQHQHHSKCQKCRFPQFCEQHRTPTFNYAAFATDNGCGALQCGGGGTTN